MIPCLILTAILSGSAGWCWGHATARIRHVPIGATADEDDETFIADERARFDQLVAGLDDTADDPQATP